MCPALHRAGEQPPVCHLSLNYQMDSKWLKIALKHFLPTPIREIFCWRLRVRKHLPTCPNTGITWSPAPAVLLKFARQLPVCTLQSPYLASAMWLYSDLWSSGVLLRRLFFQVKYSEKTVLCRKPLLSTLNLSFQQVVQRIITDYKLLLVLVEATCAWTSSPNFRWRHFVDMSE